MLGGTRQLLLSRVAFVQWHSGKLPHHPFLDAEAVEPWLVRHNQVVLQAP